MLSSFVFELLPGVSVVNASASRSKEPEHRLAEFQRFFRDYKILKGKEVDMGDFSDPQAAKEALRHAIRLYDEHFAQTGHASGTKAG